MKRTFLCRLAGLAAPLLLLAAPAAFAADTPAGDGGPQPVTLQLACTLEKPTGEVAISFDLAFNEPQAILLRTDHTRAAAATMGSTEIAFSLQGEHGNSLTRIDRKTGVLIASIEGMGSMSGHCRTKPGGAVSF